MGQWTRPSINHSLAQYLFIRKTIPRADNKVIKGLCATMVMFLHASPWVGSGSRPAAESKAYTAAAIAKCSRAAA